MSEQSAAATAAGGLERSDREALLLGGALALAGATAAGIAASRGAIALPWLEDALGHPGAVLVVALAAALGGLLAGAAARWAMDVARSLWHNRRLTRDFVRRDLRGRYAGAWLGFFWSVVHPIVSLVVYLFVFRIVLKSRWSDTMGAQEVTLMMLAGIVVWSALAETLARTTTSMHDNANLIQKVVFPAEVLPTYLSTSALFNMSWGLPVVLLANWWVSRQSGDYATAREAALAAGKGVGPALHIGLPLVLLPVLYAVQLAFMVGLGLFLSTLNVLVRDVQQIIGVVTMVWMFGTPIFYSEELVRKAGYGFLLEINPMYWLISAYRSVLLYGAWPDWALLLRFAVVALIVLGLGARFLARHKPSFPDLI
jgi:homopolymeric O-antigen transport system permease protein